MTSGDYDIKTPGGRLNCFRPVDEKGEPVHTYEWAELMGVGADVLGYVLRNRKTPGMDIINRIDDWLRRNGYGDDALRWWRLGGDIPAHTKPGKKNAWSFGVSVERKTINQRKRKGVLLRVVSPSSPPLDMPSSPFMGRRPGGRGTSLKNEG